MPGDYDPIEAREYQKLINLWKKKNPEIFPKKKTYTDEELRKMAEEEKKMRLEAMKQEEEIQPRLRRVVYIDRYDPNEKKKKMTWEEYNRRYRNIKKRSRSQQPKKKIKKSKKPVRKTQPRPRPKPKPKTKTKQGTKNRKPSSGRKKNSVLSDGYFMKNGKKFTLTKEFKSKIEAEKMVKKLRSEGYCVELSVYSPKKHSNPYKVYKGPKKQRRGKK